jgi:hypothetical protein
MVQLIVRPLMFASIKLIRELSCLFYSSNNSFNTDARRKTIACNFCAFLLERRSVFAGVLAGETVLVFGAVLFAR